MLGVSSCRGLGRIMSLILVSQRFSTSAATRYISFFYGPVLVSSKHQHVCANSRGRLVGHVNLSKQKT